MLPACEFNSECDEEYTYCGHVMIGVAETSPVCLTYYCGADPQPVDGSEFMWTGRCNMGTDTASGADLALPDYFIYESEVIDTELEVCTKDSDCTGD